LVTKKYAGLDTPATEAVTKNEPATLLAVNAGAVTTAFASVGAMKVFVPFAKVPEGPVEGATNSTATPATGLLTASSTWAWKRVGKDDDVEVDCASPARATTW
jgi:hypothetical protein